MSRGRAITTLVHKLQEVSLARPKNIVGVLLLGHFKIEIICFWLKSEASDQGMSSAKPGRVLCLVGQSHH